MLSDSMSVGMPGGSWTIGQEGSARCSVPQDSAGLDWRVTPAVVSSHCSTPIPVPKEQPAQYEVVTVDPAKLEEIFLLASPTSTASKDTWRVRISPEYDIQILPPEPHGNEIVVARVRDSPEQRRSRCLSTIFPELANDIHSVSRSSKDNSPAQSILDPQWEFAQQDVALGPDSSADEERSEQEESGQDCGRLSDRDFGLLLFLSQAMEEEVSHEDNGWTETDPAPRDSDLSTSHRQITSGLDSSLHSDVSSGTQNPRSAAEPVSPTSPSTATPLTSPMSLRSTFQADEVDAASSEFGDSDEGEPVSPTSLPSTACLLTSPMSLTSRPTLQADEADAASGGLGDSNEGEPESCHVEERSDDQLLTPSSLDASLADHPCRESVDSTIARTVTASVLSEDRPEHHDQEDSDYELEYLTEFSVLTPLSLPGLDSISSPNSLGIDFGAFNDWELVPHPPVGSTSGNEPFLGNVVAQSQPLVSVLIAPQDGPEDNPVTKPAVLAKDTESCSVYQSVPEQPRPAERHIPESSDKVTSSPRSIDSYLVQDAAGAIGVIAPGDDLGAEAEKLASPSYKLPFQTDDPSVDESIQPILKLPELDFHPPSLTDEVLHSPVFRLTVFGDHNPGTEAAPPLAPVPVASGSKHLRALSASHAERTSILWAPHDTKYMYQPTWSASEKGKGTARWRSSKRTVSDDSGSAQTARVEREVQTEVDDLRARYARVKKELKDEKAKVAKLRQETSKAPERSEYSLFSWGVPTTLEDFIV
ncbi:hypothetical protein B0H15DRAFT_421086 [Mycena belliarum]|uniref:Uncharacterized protein n=1 Tax=Mycena belliarum TaxID=1033014 RepID=A0AAD6U015_9AGAR|nr:hypothetical protein B0H15DRAFT_421086 [Mycena belliae]